MRTFFLFGRLSVSTWFAAFTALLFGAHVALAQNLSPDQVAGMRFRTIVVDTSAFADRGQPGYAAKLRAIVAAQAQSVFADRLAPQDKRAPNLVIRVDSVMFSDISHHSNHGFRGIGSESTDYMEGAGLIVSGGHVILNHPMLAAHDARSDTMGETPERLDELANFYVAWLKKEMGL